MAYVSLVIVDVVAGPALEFPIAPGTFSVPEAAAFTLVWACSVAAIAWALGMLTIRHDQRLATGSVNFLFILVWFLLLSPSIWRWLTVHPGGSLRDVLGSEQAVWLFIVIGLAGISFAFAPRLAVPASRSRSALVPSRTATRADRNPLSLTRRWTALAEVPRMFGVVLALTLAGLLFFLILPLPRETPFLVRQTFMLIWLYMVPALWVSNWLPAARVFRCLPLSRIRLAVLPVMYAMLICLAGGVSVGVVMVLTERATRVFTPLLWWLLLCPGLLSLFYSVAVRSARPKRELRAQHLDDAGSWEISPGISSSSPELSAAVPPRSVSRKRSGLPQLLAFSWHSWVISPYGAALSCIRHIDRCRSPNEDRENLNSWLPDGGADEQFEMLGRASTSARFMPRQRNSTKRGLRRRQGTVDLS